MKQTLLPLLLLFSLQLYGQFEQQHKVTPNAPAPRDSVFGLHAASRADIATGQAQWGAIEAGGAAEAFDDFVAILSDGVGTNPVFFIFDNFEGYTMDTLYESDTGVFIFEVGGYDYGLQDDFTWVSATCGGGVANMLHRFGPIDNFGGTDGFMLEVFDDAGAPAEIEGYYYIEVRIYTTLDD